MEGFKSLFAKKSSDKLSERESESLENLKDPLKKILETLKPQIEAGAYNLIVGDDASGRIPTRILARVIQEVSQRMGHRPPMVRFIAGSTALHSHGIDEWIKKSDEVAGQIGKMQDTLIKNGYKNGRALIVTDTVKMGRSIDVLMKGLHANGVSGDVATVGLEATSPETWVPHLEEQWQAKVAWGMKGTPGIYRAGKKLSGVRKESTDLFAKPDKPDWFYRPASVDKQRAARDRADDLATEILAEMFPSSSKGDPAAPRGVAPSIS